MNIWLLIIVTLIYTGVSINYFLGKDIPMCIAFAGYAFANIGFIIYTLQ